MQNSVQRGMGNSLIDFQSKASKFKSFDDATNTLTIELLPENGACAHWFDFAVTFTRKVDTLAVRIDNADESRYQAGWTGYHPYVLREDKWVPSCGDSRYYNGKFDFAVEKPGSKVDVA